MWRWARGGVDLARCLALRHAVFVEEQGVAPEEDVDGLDTDCRHAMAEMGGRLVGTGRIRPAGRAVKIERVAIARERRGTGAGAGLMRWILAELEVEGWTEAVLGAQTHAVAFYERLSFVASRPEFLDAGIPHRHMRRSLRRRPED